MRRNFRVMALLGVAAMAAAGSMAQGAAIPTYAGGGESSFALSTPNLLTNATFTTGEPSTLGSQAALVDGKYGVWDSVCFFNSPGGVNAVVLVLKTPSDISQIRTISNWSTTDLVAQDYTVSYTTDANPTAASTYTVIGKALGASNPTAARTFSEEVLFGDKSVSIVGGATVTALKFDVNGQNVMGEWEASAVPEPTSLSLLGLVGGSLLGRRRK